MENPAVSGLRSRSRSKTPFLRSSCDHENCLEGGEHTHPQKSGRKTPVKRSTPIKQVRRPSTAAKYSEELLEEETFAFTGHGSKNLVIDENVVDRMKGNIKEVVQNQINSEYERVSTSSQRYATLADVTLSPIYTSQGVTHDRSSRLASPSSYSACSTDSSFAEQALADASILLEVNPNSDHLPSRLYKMAREYWNKYPKTDYTYSTMSKDRVELAPGQVAMPNMSRRSLSQFRVQGPNTSVDELDRLAATTSWTTSTVRRRYTSIDSSDDESTYPRGNGGAYLAEQHWWITQLLITMITSVTSSVRNTYRKVMGPPHQYPLTDRRPKGVISRSASAVAAPFVWIYTMIKTVVTTTVTTVTETLTPNHVGNVNEKYFGEKPAKRRWWPWFLLLLLPALGYGSHYTYQNWERLAMVNFTDFRLDLSEYSALQMSKLSLPNISLPSFEMPKMPDINITLPDISENLPEMKKTYIEYRDIVQNRVADASDYVVVVADSCFQEVKKAWRELFG